MIEIEDDMINPGGINGIGGRSVNVESEDFQYMRRMIAERYEALDPITKIKNAILGIRLEMQTYLAGGDSDSIKSVGYFIEELLKAAGVSKKHFAKYIGYDYANFIALTKNRRKINYDTAIKMGQTFQIDPLLLLRIETKNEMTHALSKLETSYRLEDLIGDPVPV